MITSSNIGDNGRFGNQLFQFCFAHYLKESGYKVRFENYPIWSPGLSYSLKKLKTICPHVDFSINPTISHTSILGRMYYRLKIAIPLSDIYMRYARYTRFIESPNQYFTARDLSTLPNVKKSILELCRNLNYLLWDDPRMF